MHRTNKNRIAYRAQSWIFMFSNPGSLPIIDFHLIHFTGTTASDMPGTSGCCHGIDIYSRERVVMAVQFLLNYGRVCRCPE